MRVGLIGEKKQRADKNRTRPARRVTAADGLDSGDHLTFSLVFVLI